MKLAVIAVSTGGPRILARLLRDLPLLEAAIVLVQHMPRFIGDSVCRTLNATTAMNVALAKEGGEIAPGHLTVAPGDRHLCFVRNRHTKLSDGPKVNYVRPSADVTMQSVTAQPGDDLAAIILTGLGSDGARGAVHMKSLGATILAQDRDSSVIYGMPKAALEAGVVDQSMPPEGIRDWLIQWSLQSLPGRNRSAITRG